MNPGDRDQIARWAAQRRRDVVLGLVDTGDVASASFRRFCQEMGAIAPGVRWKSEEPGPDGFASIRLRDNLRYCAVPEGPELPPFLDALAGTSDGFPRHDRLEYVDTPADLRLYIAPQCPFCPTVVRQVMAMALQTTRVQLTVIDAFLFSERAEQDGVRSVPTVLLDPNFRWTGQFSVGELIDVMANRAPGDLGTDTLERIVSEGGASVVAGMMRAENRLLPAFLELLFHDKWSVRLGAMVVMEDLLENDPPFRDFFDDSLAARFDGLDRTVQGDMCYLLGISRSTKAAAMLAAVATGEYDAEVRAAADESRQGWPP